jgi:hypothetical protein
MSQLIVYIFLLFIPSTTSKYNFTKEIRIWLQGSIPRYKRIHHLHHLD